MDSLSLISPQCFQILYQNEKQDNFKYLIREQNSQILTDIYEDFYSKTYNLVKKIDPLYANSDQDFELFLRFLKDHNMENYANFLFNYEKDKTLLMELEKDIDSYKKYFNAEDESFLHLNMGLQFEEDGSARNLGNFI